MYLILNSFEAFDEQRKNSDKKEVEMQFRFAISNPNNPFDIVHQNIDLARGFFYSFKVSASISNTSPNFEALTQNVRNCLFSHEAKNLSYFRNYSKSGCNYECALRQAIEDCKCVPWNMPRVSMQGKWMIKARQNNGMLQQAWGGWVIFLSVQGFIAPTLD